MDKPEIKKKKKYPQEFDDLSERKSVICFWRMIKLIHVFIWERGNIKLLFKSFLCGWRGLLFVTVRSYSGSLLYTVVNTTGLQRILSA